MLNPVGNSGFKAGSACRKKRYYQGATDVLKFQQQK